MSPGQTGHVTGQMGRVPGTDGTHTRGCPAKILYVYWFFSFPIENDSKTTEKRLEINSPGGVSVVGVDESGEWAVPGKQYHYITGFKPA